MTPSAHIATTIELLEQVAQARVPADRVMASYFRQHRYIGSKDKAAIAQAVYLAIRHQSELAYAVHHAGLKETARSLVLAMLVRFHNKSLETLKQFFSSEKYAPARLSDVELKAIPKLEKIDMAKAPVAVRCNFPAELKPVLQQAFGDKLEQVMQASNGRAPADIRVNTLKTSRDALQALLSEQGMESTPTPYSPYGLRLEGRHNLFSSQAFKDGLFEVQDEGSQLLGLLCAPKPGHTVVDYCAGAGGKTLSLAAQMANKGTVYACDIHSYRLEELKQRARRAGVHNVRIHQLEGGDRWHKKHAAMADVVLVDAPCSGSGTWRRNPDMKWKTTLEDIAEVQQVQQQVLAEAATLVKKGGKLVYATCSILPQENAEQVQAFLAQNPQFKLVPLAQSWPNGVKQPEDCQDMLQLLPNLHQTDGFFAAVMEKIA